MTKFIRSIAIPALLLLSFTFVAPAQRGQTLMLGEANVDGAVDHDNISVTASQGAFRAIQLRVLNNAVQFQRVLVHYGNGQTQPLQLRNTVPAGGATRVIALPGQRRIIQSLELWYARADWGARRPKVQLYGVR